LFRKLQKWRKIFFFCYFFHRTNSVLILAKNGLSYILVTVSQTHLVTLPIASICVATRVTRLGEFSPIGRLFTLGSVMKITEVAKHFGLLIKTETVMYSFDKKWVGQHFGLLFFSNSSGHPGRLATIVKNEAINEDL
jgi:hypothetical protein